MAAVYTIPTSTTASWYEETVTLDGSEFLLRFQWSERERRWYLDMETGDGTLLMAGVKVVCTQDLNTRLTSTLRPAGMLMTIDASGGGIDPDLRDLGSRVLLYYADEDAIDG